MWVHRQPIDSAPVVTSVLQRILGNEDADAVLAASKSQEVKDALSRYTDEATDEGAFGLPWFVGESSQILV